MEVFLWEDFGANAPDHGRQTTDHRRQLTDDSGSKEHGCSSAPAEL